MKNVLILKAVSNVSARLENNTFTPILTAISMLVMDTFHKMFIFYRRVIGKMAIHVLI